VVTFRTDQRTDVTTTVGDCEVHDLRPVPLRPDHGVGARHRIPARGSTEAQATALLPRRVTTLTRPAGRHLATIATVSTTCISEKSSAAGSELPRSSGRSCHAEPGEPSYPSVMNAGAIAEIESLDPDAVVVKGDLTDLGSDEQ